MLRHERERTHTQNTRRRGRNLCGDLLLAAARRATTRQTLLRPDGLSGTHSSSNGIGLSLSLSLSLSLDDDGEKSTLQFLGDLVSAGAAMQVPGGSRSACSLLSSGTSAGFPVPSCSVLLESLCYGPISPIGAGRIPRSRRWQPRGCSTAAAVTMRERRLCPAKILVLAVAGRSADSS